MNAQPNTTTHQIARTEHAINRIKRIVAEHFGFPEGLLIAKDRSEPLATRRQLAMVLAYQQTRASLPVVARAFERVDHNTVRHAIHAIEAKLDNEPELKTARDAILRKL